MMAWTMKPSLTLFTILDAVFGLDGVEQLVCVAGTYGRGLSYN